VVCWGNNTWGQLNVPSGELFVQIDAGDGHCAGLRPDGTAVCWGRNDMGQCDAPAVTRFSQLQTGGLFTVAVRRNLLNDRLDEMQAQIDALTKLVAANTAAIDALPACSCIGDLNGDGFVNGGDLGLLIAAWGTCPK
jgi:hypothetical protein